jgi:hypothetical protein
MHFSNSDKILTYFQALKLLVIQVLCFMVIDLRKIKMYVKEIL